MKILCYFGVFIPLLLNAQSDSTAYQGIRFEQILNWEQIKTKAKAENKYVFVDCYATWCGPCRMMDNDVYSQLHVGYAMNDHFISVKVQMDSSKKDNAIIKKWYADAQKIRQDYKVSALPSYLFFSPQGDLVHKKSGYMDASSFIQLTKSARDPNRTLYYTQYRAYKQDKKHHSSMGSLAIFTKEIIGDTILANAIAKSYKKNYLDKLETAALFTKENINFICKFPDVVHSTNEFFKLGYNAPQQFDSIRGIKGTATWLVHRTIIREEIANKILKNGMAVTKMPNWDQLQLNVSKKYKLINAGKLVLRYKIGYYRDQHKDWALWAKYKDEMIKNYLPKPPYGLYVYTEINGYGGAWHAFLHCKDTNVLIKALEWVNLALKLDGELHSASYLDTKANLLYKLGRRKEALQLQKKAVELIISSGGIPGDIENAYQKMLRGEPTWDVQ